MSAAGTSGPAHEPTQPMRRPGYEPGPDPTASPKPRDRVRRTSPPFPPGDDAPAGGRYVLGRTLGEGGMGVVRHARDQLLHRDVAVKLLADDLAADDHARQRFLREARAAASIVHPNVVAVYDVGTCTVRDGPGDGPGSGDHDATDAPGAGDGPPQASDGGTGAGTADGEGRPYLVMEFVDGPSLADVLAGGGPLPCRDVIDVASDALAGIGRAHAADLLHRDIKPGNLLRGRDRTAKVTDFGVAEAADLTGLTGQGAVVGTRAYLAPERRRGEPATVQTDLYALGVTLAELLTGTPPQPGEVPELPADASPRLRHLLTTLLDPDPRGRPTDAAAALQQLHGGRAHRPGRTHRAGPATPPLPGPGTPTPPAGRVPRRRLATVAAAAVVAVAGAAIITANVAPSDSGSGSEGSDEVRPASEAPADRMRELERWLRDEHGGR